VKHNIQSEAHDLFLRYTIHAGLVLHMSSYSREFENGPHALVHSDSSVSDLQGSYVGSRAFGGRQYAECRAFC